MSTGVSISGMEAVFAKMDMQTAKTTLKIGKALKYAAIECQAEAKKACPVDTGRLRASIQYTNQPLSARVSTNVNYSKFIEFGTKKMKAQPFLYPAFVLAGQHLQEELSSL